MYTVFTTTVRIWKGTTTNILGCQAQISIKECEKSKKSSKKATKTTTSGFSDNEYVHSRTPGQTTRPRIHHHHHSTSRDVSPPDQARVHRNGRKKNLCKQFVLLRAHQPSTARFATQVTPHLSHYLRISRFARPFLFLFVLVYFEGVRAPRGRECRSRPGCVWGLSAGVGRRRLGWCASQCRGW